MLEQQDFSQLSNTETNTVYHLQLKRLTDILDAALSVYWRHFRVFGPIVAIYFVLDSLREGVFSFLAENKGLIILDEYTEILISALVYGLCVVVASEIYLGKATTLQNAIRGFQNRFPSYFGSTIIYLFPFLLLPLIPEEDYPEILTVIGFFIGFPVAIYYLISLIFYGPVVIVEREASFDALRRSRDLVRGTWWKIFWRVIGILVFIITIDYILTVSFGLLFAFLGLIHEVSAGSTIIYVLQAPFELSRIDSVASAIMRFLDIGANAFTTPIIVISVTLLYFNSRFLMRRLPPR